MPGTNVVEDIELIIEDIGGGGGKQPPADDGGGDDGGRGRRRGKPSPNRYSTAVALGIVSVLMFFMSLSSAFIVLKGASDRWVPVRLPNVLWANTAILLLSSYTLERARRRLANGDERGFQKLWRLTTGLGILFLAGQLIAWRELVAQGVYIASNQASSFFYIFTAAHGVHLLGGVAVLLYVLLRNFDRTKLTRGKAAEITSYYWHFMDGLWVFLLALLYFGK
jgi:cytochrome c oxidase subunit III